MIVFQLFRYVIGGMIVLIVLSLSVLGVNSCTDDAASDGSDAFTDSVWPAFTAKVPVIKDSARLAAIEEFDRLFGVREPAIRTYASSLMDSVIVELMRGRFADIWGVFGPYVYFADFNADGREDVLVAVNGVRNLGGRLFLFAEDEYEYAGDFETIGYTVSVCSRREGSVVIRSGYTDRWGENGPHVTDSLGRKIPGPLEMRSFLNRVEYALAENRLELTDSADTSYVTNDDEWAKTRLKSFLFNKGCSELEIVWAAERFPDRTRVKYYLRPLI